MKPLTDGTTIQYSGLQVHATGGHVTKHIGRSIYTDVNDNTRLQLHVSDHDGAQIWMSHTFYSETQAKTRETQHCPNEYAEIGRTLEDCFNDVFGP